ncbi:MAG: hypothetical protein AAF418_04760 [Pseudomonadota bacterium]
MQRCSHNLRRSLWLMVAAILFVAIQPALVQARFDYAELKDDFDRLQVPHDAVYKLTGNSGIFELFDQGELAIKLTNHCGFWQWIMHWSLSSSWSDQVFDSSSRYSWAGDGSVSFHHQRDQVMQGMISPPDEHGLLHVRYEQSSTLQLILPEDAVHFLAERALLLRQIDAGEASQSYHLFHGLEPYAEAAVSHLNDATGLPSWQGRLLHSYQIQYRKAQGSAQIRMILEGEMTSGGISKSFSLRKPEGVLDFELTSLRRFDLPVCN